jgi:O-antigen/teichoic acid export membrane protein
MGSHLKEVISNAGVSLLLRLVGAAAQFIFSVVIARMYGAEGFGIYTLALSFTVISSVIGRWGLDQAALKFIAIYAERGEWSEVRAIQKRALKLVMLISSICTILLLVASQWLARYLFHQPDLDTLLQIMVFAILPFSGLNLLAECLRAVKNISAYTVIQGVLVPTFSILTIFLFAQFNFSIFSAAYAYVLACWVTFIVALYLWSRFTKMTGESTISSCKMKLFETAAPMALVTIVAILMSFSETVLLGLFRSSEDIGIYSAALRLAMLTSFIVIAFNSILAPKFASLIRENRKTTVQKVARDSVAMMLVVALPLLVILIFYPEGVLKLFGYDFEKGATVLVILAFAQLVNVIMGPAGLLLMMGGGEKVMRKLTLNTWLISTVAGLFLIPQFGAIGAACSAFIGIVLLNILAVLQVKKLLGITLLYKIS